MHRRLQPLGGNPLSGKSALGQKAHAVEGEALAQPRLVILLDELHRRGPGEESVDRIRLGGSKFGHVGLKLHRREGRENLAHYLAAALLKPLTKPRDRLLPGGIAPADRNARRMPRSASKRPMGQAGCQLVKEVRKMLAAQNSPVAAAAPALGMMRAVSLPCR